MQVVVITRKMWMTALGVLLLVALGIGLWFLFQGRTEEPVAPAMTLTNGYELNTIPYTARELPVYSVQTEEKCLALTIDAAWDTDKTQFILDTLDRYDIHATFFLCGVWVDAYPEFVKEIAARGHEIGNHSLTHPHMSKLSKQEIERELLDLNAEIERLTGTACTLFRAPFGEYNDTVVSTVRELGFEIVQWNIDTVDWKESRTADAILATVKEKLAPGSIILCHNNGYAIEEYLPKLLAFVTQEGYSFVTVSDLLPKGERDIDGNGVWRVGAASSAAS